jgi:group II intron reverse transcriptase/maturase
MRSTETVLAVIRDRGRRRLPLEDVYRQLFNPELYRTAYGKLAKNKGALTPGTTTETVDGMSEETIHAIIEAVRFERYRWSPARRIYIEKKNSTKRRPLGMPTWSDKLLQEVVRMILDAYYEPQFSDRSHGFRPQLGCGTALEAIYQGWTGTTWFIEGDISSYFDTIDHKVMMETLRIKIHDNRFLRLIENLLKAGYLENWKLNATLSGTPQGGVVSPILSNIYLDRLGQFVEQVLMPEYNRGTKRAGNKAYHRQTAAISLFRRKNGDQKQARRMAQQAKQMPSRDPSDPEYRRLKYVRYADDFLIGVTGPKAETEEIKRRIGEFLRETLKLELSEEKTLLTHASTAEARFLGYSISVNRDNQRRGIGGNRTLGGQTTFKIPKGRVTEAMKPYMKNGKPVHRKTLTHDAAYSIVQQYQAEYRGLVEYYRKAINLRDFSKLKWVMEQSLTKTLAHKMKISVPKVYRRYSATLETKDGVYKGLRIEVKREGRQPLIATWGGVSMKRVIKGRLDDHPVKVWNTSGTEIVERLLAQTCERCGSTDRINVHHVRALRDLQTKGQTPRPDWVVKMASRQRKTLVVCHQCHYHDIHRHGTRGTVERS